MWVTRRRRGVGRDYVKDRREIWRGRGLIKFRRSNNTSLSLSLARARARVLRTPSKNGSSARKSERIHRRWYSASGRYDDFPRRFTWRLRDLDLRVRFISLRQRGMELRFPEKGGRRNQEGFTKCSWFHEELKFSDIPLRSNQRHLSRFIIYLIERVFAAEKGIRSSMKDIYLYIYIYIYLYIYIYIYLSWSFGCLLYIYIN